MGLGAAIAIEELIGTDIKEGKVVIAHPARRPTRRHFVLQAEARHVRDADLLTFASWLEANLAPNQHAHSR